MRHLIHLRAAELLKQMNFASQNPSQQIDAAEAAILKAGNAYYNQLQVSLKAFQKLLGPMQAAATLAAAANKISNFRDMFDNGTEADRQLASKLVARASELERFTFMQTNMIKSYIMSLTSHVAEYTSEAKRYRIDGK